MHFDFHLGNLLTEAGEVTGVVDWDGTCSGDKAFDLATLLFYTYDQEEAREILCQALLDRTGWQRARVYLAHVMLRQTAWSAAHHNRQTVGAYLATSAVILKDLGLASG
jgi:aminoglycoside phosphotransferase (APT) family kinase protein